MTGVRLQWRALLVAVLIFSCGAGRVSAQCSLPTGTTFSESFGNGTGTCWTGGPAVCNQAWKITRGSTYSIVPAPGGATPDQACTSSLSLAASSSAVKLQSYGSIPYIPAGNTVDLYFSLYVSAAPNNNVTFLQLRSTVSGGTLAQLVWRNAAGTYLVASGATSSANTAVALNAWHSVQLHVDGMAANSYLAIDGGPPQTFTAAAQDMNSIAMNGDVAGSYYLGNLYLNAPGFGPSGSPMLADFAGGVNGAVITNAAMNAGSHCGNVPWQVDANQTAMIFSNAETEPLHTSVNACGNTYSGDSGTSVRFDMSSTQGATYPFTTLSPNAAFGFFYYTTVPANNQTFYCNARITGVYDYACVHQHGNGKTLQIFLEVFNGPELFGAPIPILPNTWYWVTLQYNAGGTHHLRVYETQNYTLIGSSDGPSGNGTDLPIRFDFGHSGSELAPPGTYLYFSNLTLDWVTGTYPLGPGGGDVPAAPIFLSANSANFTGGSASSFIVKATGSPVPTLSATGTPPSGVAFDPSTGILSGTPTPGQSGAYPLQFTATNNLGSAEQDFTLNLMQGQTAAPTFSPRGGTFNAVQTVTLADTTPGAVIYYTTDGSVPSPLSTPYAGPLTVASSTPVAAMAVAAGFNNSNTASATYTLKLPVPTFTPAAGSYNGAQSVTIANAVTGASIYYTTDGSTPRTTSTPYTVPISVAKTETVAAIAAMAGWTNSSSASAAYTINPGPATPGFSVKAGTYSSTQNVTITDSTTGTSIYYTTDGTTPSASSIPYTVPVSVTQTMTLQAIAVTSSGDASSAVASALYTLQPATPTLSVGTGNYNAAQSVTISDTTPGTSIFYTTDGSPPTTSSTPYAGPVAISSTTTLTAIATATGWSNSANAAATYTLQPATPMLSVPSGTYSAAQSVTISETASGATIYYTTDGSTPTSSSTPYGGPITIAASGTLSAIAAMPGWSNSAASSAAYTLKPAAPILSVPSGSYSAAQSVTISDLIPSAAIYYTTDGSAPTIASTPYAGPVTISASGTLTAIAAMPGWSNSTSTASVYTLKAATPTFGPIAGTYGAAQQVTISDASPGVTIFYTTNETQPTTASAVYANPISVSSTTTLMAMAALTGWANSSTASAVYTINTQPPPTPTFSVAGGTYTTAPNVTISDTTLGVSLYYTLDGSTPGANSLPYTGPVAIAQTSVLKAVAVSSAGTSSAVASATYTLRPTTPQVSLASGTYNTAQSVTITDSTAGTSIFYTADGSTPTIASTPYGGAVPISATTKLTAIAAITGWTNSSTAAATYTLQAVRPTLSVAAGTFSAPQPVTILDSTPGASIYFTTNGSTPTTASALYSSPVAISATSTLTAIAALTGWTNSSSASARYTINAPATPAFSVRTGTYSTPQTVTLTDSTSGASIYYTTDNSTPTTASALYTGPISIAQTATLKAIASNGGPASAVGSNTYTLRANTPTFNVAAGTYTSAPSVTISDSTAGAVIYYTTNGSTPTTSSTLYTGPVSITRSETLEAIAVVPEWSNSSTASAAYALRVPTPTFNPAAGTYTGARTVSISASLAGATIYYTTNGSTPTTSSAVYSTPISVSSSRTVKAIATFSGWTTSNVASAAYTIH